MTFTAAAVTPEKRRQRNAKTPWPWKIFSLDSENLMRVRPGLLPGTLVGYTILIPSPRGAEGMTPEELRDDLRQRPFEPFRLVMTDGEGYDIRHPDLLWVGQRTAYVGLTGQPGQTFFERAVKVDLLHIIRTVPLDAATAPPNNGASSI
jgi:hypothetical protein